MCGCVVSRKGRVIISSLLHLNGEGGFGGVSPDSCVGFKEGLDLCVKEFILVFFDSFIGIDTHEGGEVGSGEGEGVDAVVVGEGGFFSGDAGELVKGLVLVGVILGIVVGLGGEDI